ncbi:MAG: class I SAM-dependent methyltransferase [Candidatus Roseilinea sp.]|uniref:class I SAM-dependent methyltransferase n=1 Tax=Candidatus Roseilinea sp. TaxID=2838777 RepID=UPI0040499809
MKDHSSTTGPWSRLVRFGFQQLYTRFAWAYDAIAAGVSFGEWQEWGRCAIPFLRGQRILELAHGPGHLHVTLRAQGLDVTSIDLSAQMSDIARRRVEAFLRRQPEQAGHGLRLVRADARRLPFREAAFDSVVSTFPTDFIVTPEALGEARRVLTVGGALVVVPTVDMRRSSASERVVAGLYGVISRRASDGDGPRFDERLREAGFLPDVKIVETRHADIAVWVCQAL